MFQCLFQLSMQRLLEMGLTVDFLPEKCKHCSVVLSKMALFKHPLQPSIATLAQPVVSRVSLEWTYLFDWQFDWSVQENHNYFHNFIWFSSSAQLHSSFLSIYFYMSG